VDSNKVEYCKVVMKHVNSQLVIDGCGNIHFREVIEGGPPLVLRELLFHPCTFKSDATYVVKSFMQNLQCLHAWVRIYMHYFEVIWSLSLLMKNQYPRQND
jgi:hypothetical protein